MQQLMKQTITTFLVLLLAVFAFGQELEKAVIYFNFNKFELSTASTLVLDNLVEKVRNKDILQIEINGHTDSDGNNFYNIKLAQNRANSVQQYLTSIGIPLGKIKTKSYGEQQPISNNDNEDGKQKNRRVEIIIKFNTSSNKTESNKPVPIAPQIVEIIENKISQIPYSVEREYIQTCKFSPINDFSIIGDKGTIIQFPKYAFVDANGIPVKNEITIELLEIYSKSDMILNNIQTISDENLIESGGMIYIKAFFQNKELELDKNKYYTIKFPTKNKEEDMQIFYGDTTMSNINWKQANRNFIGDITYVENLNELNKYIFNSTKLGWINCDRFYDVDEKTTLIVNTIDTFDVNFCLVFKSINSVMNVSEKKDTIKFKNVPIGMESTLVAFKKTNNETYYSSKNITIQENQTIEIKLEKLTEQDFKTRIKQFD
jgi:hypothetical protein